jgi:hypothetical protein
MFCSVIVPKRRGRSQVRSYNVGVPLMLTMAMALSDAEIVDLLTGATTDVDWVSESDAPFEVLLWPDWPIVHCDVAALRAQIQAPQNAPIVQDTVEAFFQPAIVPQDWHGAAERSVIQQYEQILLMLQQHLTQLQLYRVGQGEVTVYILGKTPAGHWLGLKTLVVES